ncbi:LegC family aminotransferase [Ramlibacter sp. G-1-2-2]|uniref:GDP-perosamine synthase n=1 Tax=Ramlibacter agri TaxID=2728837 RepID=A0A848HA36_9BURK|nr:LegC family aminotransferase [Ramlibacter agri]NML46882.1 LegC family aminotransferase [Ramlibacter agri]
MSELRAPLRELLAFVRELYGAAGPIPLHAPVFAGNEKRYLAECIDTTFVSSVGPFVDCFEQMMQDITGAKYAVATMNGTAALHMALILAGVTDGDEVITQPLSFVATCNALAYQRAQPVFVDIDPDTLSLSPAALKEFLESRCERVAGACRHRETGRRIAAVVPMHTFGLPGRAQELAEICERWHLVLVEDAAESLGSTIGGRHTGTFGKLGTFSFNGNKTVTSGGGGAVVTDDPALARRAKHLTTTAKVPHRWDFFHDEVGFNYRLPNLNAAVACAQLEQLEGFLANKRATAQAYAARCAQLGIPFAQELAGTRSNFWLNAILVDDAAERDAFLQAANDGGIQARPVWQLMPELPAFASATCGPLDHARAAAARIVNLPSSVRP